MSDQKDGQEKGKNPKQKSFKPKNDQSRKKSWVSKKPETRQPDSNVEIREIQNYFEEKDNKEEEGMELSIPQRTQLTEEIIKKLNSDSYECMICYEAISRKAQTFSCSRCFVIFHLSCISKWIKQADGQDWRCPACQLTLLKNQAPKQYRCFCGKHIRPEFDKFITPHSCGDPCGKLRGRGCPHPCVVPCHPGPCPPCNYMGKARKCFCGRMEYKLNCGEYERKRRICESVCKKLLNCKIHFCKKTCHEGECSKCDKLDLQQCFCGKIQEERPCGSGVWSEKDLCKKFSCHQICGKQLGCGNHICERQCHEGPCGECDRIPTEKNLCGCGKSEIQGFKRTLCTDPLPVCGEVCDKLLSCKMHKCAKTCHDGPCGPCEHSIEKPCVCGRNVVSMKCEAFLKLKQDLEEEHGREIFPPFKCDYVCKDYLSCSSHKCGRVCCPGVGLDELMRPIHRCNILCDKPLSCGNHVCSDYCHLGYCRPCSVMLLNGISCRCGKTRINEPVPCGTKPPTCKHPCTVSRPCGHPCFYPCHPGDCPPCVVLTSKMCVGNHIELKNQHCSGPRPSCSRPCGKLRRCKIHTCKRSCHDGPCSAEEEKNSEELFCTQACGRIRDCGHPCKEKCHGSDACPTVRCNEIISMTCPCKRISKRVPCYFRSSSESILCDDVCAIQKRNKALAQALNISELRQKRIPYSQWSLEHGIYNIPYIEKTEKALEKFLASNVSEKTLYLNPANIEKRLLAHEIAQQFGFVSETLGSGENRFVRITRTPTSHVPYVMLSRAIDMYKRDPESIKAREILLSSTPKSQILLVVHDGSGSLSILRNILSHMEGQYQTDVLNESELVLQFDSEAAAKSAASSILASHYFRVRRMDQIEFIEEEKVSQVSEKQAVDSEKDPDLNSNGNTSEKPLNFCIETESSNEETKEDS